MKPRDLFRFCPKCGQPGPTPLLHNAVQCGHCRFLYHFNPATAAAAFILNQEGAALFIRRAKNPGKGQLALPGGFIDVGESAEDGLRREIREEVNLELGTMEYLCSAANDYYYEDVTYSVLDLYYIGQVASTKEAAALDGVESYCWLVPARVEAAELAFGSLRAAIAAFNSRPAD